MAHTDELKKVKGTKTPAVEKPSEPKRELPRVTFTAEDIPEVKDWKIGGKYYLELEVEQVAAEKDRYGYEEDKQKPLTATFKVVAVKALNHESHKENGDEKKKKEIEFGNYKNPNRIG